MSTFGTETCPGCGDEEATITIEDDGEVLIDCGMCNKTFRRIITTAWEEVLGP
jgi:transcription elongation factor Elf1